MSSKKLLCIFLAIFMILPLNGCKSNTPITRTGFFFDTAVSITIYDSAKANVLDTCLELASDYENLFSISIPTSDISKINAANGDAVLVEAETITLIKEAIYYATLSDGIVDPTIGSLSFLWKNALVNEVPPTNDSLSEALSHVNYKNIMIDGNYVSLADSDTRLDLGFIAKGYIADKMKEYLLSQNITSGIINLGGNVLTIGSKPDNTAYTIGIQQPYEAMGTYAEKATVKNKSVVSSGVYERYFEFNGTKYHHIIDTHTGYPTSSDLLSATVISDSSVMGDALSTICLSLGSEKSLAFINELNQTLDTSVELILITSDYQILFL